MWKGKNADSDCDPDNENGCTQIEADTAVFIFDKTILRIRAVFPYFLALFGWLPCALDINGAE